jgi:hypothetical protein
LLQIFSMFQTLCVHVMESLAPRVNLNFELRVSITCDADQSNLSEQWINKLGWEGFSSHLRMKGTIIHGFRTLCNPGHCSTYSFFSEYLLCTAFKPLNFSRTVRLTVGACFLSEYYGGKGMRISSHLQLEREYQVAYLVHALSLCEGGLVQENSDSLVNVGI